MFDRFTDRARRVVARAQKASERYRHAWIGSDHLLIGLMEVEDGVAGTVLHNLNVEPERIRALVEARLEPGEAVDESPLPFTHEAKGILELAAAEALRLGHPYIGTEHLLIALVRRRGTPAPSSTGPGCGSRRCAARCSTCWAATRWRRRGAAAPAPSIGIPIGPGS